MSRLTDLIARVKEKDPDMGQELEREFKVLASRRAFGLNFERHHPESVELPGRPVRKGDKVRVLPERGSTKKGDSRLWKVLHAEKGTARLSLIDANKIETCDAPLENLVFVAEFRDRVYPGLVSVGKMERNGKKPFHTAINGENFHVLEALTYTHFGKIDAIYIDPPYNSRAKQWKYNNNYVDKNDIYRHSKWLAMMERRLKIAKMLLNQENSVLIVTIDEKEYLRLGLLLGQMFPGIRIQMISNLINPSGSARGREFYRVDEYIFFLYIGKAAVIDFDIPGLCITSLKSDATRETEDNPPKVRWEYLLRSGTDARREDRKREFYPVLVDREKGRIIRADEPLPIGKHPKDYLTCDGLTPVWPMREDGSEGRWRLGSKTFNELLENRHVKISSINKKTGKITLQYIPRELRKKMELGEIAVVGYDKFGGMKLEHSGPEVVRGKPKTQWATTAHSATDHGSSLIRKFIPRRKFPFPKSLYAVEDALRFFVADKPNAIVLDFFAGSGTTAHAVMRLNRQDGGQRQCISVTNNEVAAKEQTALRKAGFRPGDEDWEKKGIFDHITRPRIEAAIIGKTPNGANVKGKYEFTDKFPMAEGFEENVEFFALTYETHVAVQHNLAFERIAPLLWMRAGSRGRRIDSIPERGWDIADAYGLLTNLDRVAEFCEELRRCDGVRIAYIVTDDEWCFQSVVRRLPNGTEPVQLYESYLLNFRFSMDR